MVTAVATSAMARTCVVRLAASWLTLSVKIAPDAGRAGHARLAAQLAFDADFARHGGHLIGECRQRVDHAVDGVGQLGDFALGFEHQFALQVAVGDRGHHLGDTAHLGGQVGGHEVDVVGKIFPGAGDAVHFGLAAQLAFRAHFARHARHFRWRSELSWSTMVLMVFFSSRISPCTSTVILRDRSPLATAVVTCAMLRT